ncbi:serine/arginine repetitive matrix protein 1 [Cocos nucifera]|uniref:Serine/arginine repetitive matrix protein 1 n=1 Tax=Cocos nucifera TaxID=13894 RepID=A0A8K0IV65_COCNU|nr:serine/arginine repetitive matrix protein 1 [Cocos nucifera]
MDFGSPNKSLEETSKEEGPPYIGELDLNLLGNKGGKISQDETEALDENMQGYTNQEKISDYTDAGLMSTIEDYENHNKMQGADHVDLSGEQLDTSANKLPDELEPRDSYPCFDKPVLSADKNDNSDEVVDNGTYDYQSARSPSLFATENGDVGNISGNSQSGKAECSDEEMDHENFSHDTKMEGNYPEEMVASDNSGMVRECSGLHSPPKMRNGSSSPERNMSDPMERSPYSKPSARLEPLPPENNDRKSPSSPSPSKRKHSPSPEKNAVGHKSASSHDRLSPPIRQKSPPGRPTRQDSHYRDDSPRKRLSVSPRRGDSLRRRDRSASRSPLRRRDSSGSRRDRHGKSRSRSPYVRDRYQRSPRRRHSPRRRSPPPSYYSHRRSPRRPWSPPPNRNTGIGRPGRNLFVAGFSYVTTERDLEKKFSRFGRVTDVRIVRDKRSGDSRGFGFLSLERDEDADAAIRALDQTEWNGRIVLVEKSKTSAR